jgi:hypothetical protein
MQAKTHTFNKKKYHIFAEELDGWCDITNNKVYYLVISRDLNTRTGLITAIHESLHASDWKAKEQTIDRVSKEIGSFLWRLGFRKVQ